MVLLKKKWDVWMTGEQDSGLKPLLSLLENCGIRYKQGWIERVAHSDERFSISEDYKAQYTVSFRLPKALRTDPTFRERLDALVPICPEQDEDDFEGNPDEADD